MSLDEAVEELIKIANAHFSERESVEEMQAVIARYTAAQTQSTDYDAHAQLIRAFVSRGVSAAFKTSGAMVLQRPLSRTGSCRNLPG
jgi:hypothetical protein